MYCEQAGEMMSEWLDGRLEEARYVALGTHLAECGACAGELQALQALDRLLAAAPRAAAPPQLQARVMARLERRTRVQQAAAGALVLGLGALALVLLMLVPLVVWLLGTGSLLPALWRSGPQALGQLVALVETAGRVLWLLLRNLAAPLAALSTCALALLLLVLDCPRLLAWGRSHASR